MPSFPIIPLPHKYFSSFTALAAEIHHQRIKLILFDKDQTLVPHLKYAITDPQIQTAINSFKTANIAMYIVSNSTRDHPGPKTVNDIPILQTKQLKPYNYKEVSELLGGKAEEMQKDMCVVGDRLLTDIKLANFLGCKGYLIKSTHETTIAKNGIGTYLLKKFEESYLRINSVKIE